jgi:PST family polysaccharide transporter
LTLTIISVIILSIIVFSFEKFRNDWGIYFLTFGMVIGQVLFPVWFFQGMERMKYITFLNITAKIIFTISIFIFVHKASDYIYVPLLNSLGFMVAGIMALWIVFRDFEVDFRFPSLEALKHQLKEGWHIFNANMMGNIYGQGTVVILGLVSSDTIVGYYSVAERLVKAIASVSQPVAQALYPYLSRKKNKELRDFIFKSYRPVIFIVLSVLILCFFPVYWFYIFMVKNVNGSISITFIILYIGMFFTILNVLKQPIIYALKLDRLNNLMYSFTGLSFIPVCFILSNYFNMLGTSLSFLYVELLIFLIGIWIIIKGVKYD